MIPVTKLGVLRRVAQSSLLSPRLYFVLTAYLDRHLVSRFMESVIIV